MAKNKNPIDDIFSDFTKGMSDLFGSWSQSINLRTLPDEVLLAECDKRGLFKPKSPAKSDDKMQLPPKRGGKVVTESLIEFLEKQNNFSCSMAIDLVRERDAFGRKKYGQPLMTEDGRNHVEDALQELGDLLQYVWACRMTGQDTNRIEVLIPALHAILSRF